ncbi:aminotransferase class V-fold PLP-dependent enzyme [Streptomyces sp. NRRL S-87]|uniref:aminotransferase class V-fold PLP-dependent enzyme n=1 Tax=Streptomyces sp. NRRL S-87 TaxID=1463920 RepID=UPI00068E243B|nr:aminotransferase class V-fold PLP-dependent enzyme [Streptomyces sp. NRRL S-87]
MSPYPAGRPHLVDPGPAHPGPAHPGPARPGPAVRPAPGEPDPCHPEAGFGDLMTRVREKVAAVCGGGAEHTAVVLTGSGTAAIEAALASAVPADGGVLVIDNGHDGERLHAVLASHGIRSRRLQLGWGAAVDPGLIGRLLAADPTLGHVAVVHHETSTGVLNDVAAVAAVARAHGRRTVVDAVGSVGAEDVDVARDGIDWLVGTADTCLEGVPGLAFVCARREAFEELAGHPRRGFYLDLHRHYRAQEGDRAPAFTPAVPLFHAFEAALDLVLAEGVAARGDRYRALAERLRTGLARLGLGLLASDRPAVGLTAVHLPEGMTYERLHEVLKRTGFAIHPCQGPLAEGFFRLPTTGRRGAADVDRLLAVLETVLPAPAADADGRRSAEPSPGTPAGTGGG